ncbi:MAG: cob(I)yrinic acid a,c-diamide adenosyltransferase [Deltaproteobacteria bacterium]|nr:cob(I)yrinic acid a,c-diamide adenosyltransferase [Deltaproteobacteria bacterium]
MSVIINQVITKQGDDGKTSIINGKRQSKGCLRLEACGALDELNAQLGLTCESLATSAEELKNILLTIQHQLFDLGSELATVEPYEGMWRATDVHVSQLENLCLQYNKDLGELKSFVLPCGSPLAARFHILRTVTRRVERDIVRFGESVGEISNPNILRYINRLSDLFFILGRWVLVVENRPEILYVVEKHRL